MADQEPDDTRPRRALGDTDPNLTRVNRPSPALDPESEPKPLFRDEVSSHGSTARGEVSTQILPRTRRGGLGSSRSDFDSEDGPADRLVPGRRLGRRTALGLVIAAVAAVVIGGLAIGYSVLKLPADSALSPNPPATAPADDPTGSATPTGDPAALLTDDFALTAAQAKLLAPNRSWQVATTQRGLDEESPVAACLPGVAEGQLPAQQTILRLLRSSGKNPPAAMHQADAFATPQEAARAYTVLVTALGGCTMTGAYLQSGHVSSVVGDHPAAAVVRVATGAQTDELRSVVLSRTGRVVNVLDVAQPGAAVSIPAVAQAMRAVTNVQCSPAGGRCSSAVAVTDGPPPAGGDQPGFLAAGDLPPVGSPATGWAGTVPTRPSADFTGSGCETTNWAKEPAQQRAARTYLLADGNPKFGLDAIVVTSASNQAAQALAAKVKADLDSCAGRKLTATVTDVRPVRGVGAARVPVAGWTAAVQQKTTKGNASYRVGVVSARNKTVFTFLNPQPRLDLSDAKWAMVVVRAGQRATQVK